MVGEKIRELRTAQNFTLSELGQELGISHQQLQKYETGTNRLSAGMLASVARVLRVPIAELFQDAEAGTPDKRDPVTEARARCHTLIDRTNSVPKLESMAKVLRALSSD
ncbi:helix-turn-helix transcriptional regulator [Hyphomonas sp.]|uniref:helix-turn-helix domain-containing protein n=1 Tax=Hyphomonas sp. TaxID=87 RepID=UPI0025C46067|nr:helix-turn-helix transcriptional regulator [Hyphomonas sp.]